MPKLANELANQFSKLDSSHTKYYRQNAAKYIQSLAPLQKLIKTVKQNVDQNNKLVDVSEPVFSIALAHLGIRLIIHILLRQLRMVTILRRLILLKCKQTFGNERLLS